jgi:hypothetical protein
LPAPSAKRLPRPQATPPSSGVGEFETKLR